MPDNTSLPSIIRRRMCVSKSALVVRVEIFLGHCIARDLCFGLGNINVFLLAEGVSGISRVFNDLLNKENTVWLVLNSLV